MFLQSLIAHVNIVLPSLLCVVFAFPWHIVAKKHGPKFLLYAERGLRASNMLWTLPLIQGYVFVLVWGFPVLLLVMGFQGLHMALTPPAK
jgi:hypothetical protein